MRCLGAVWGMMKHGAAVGMVLVRGEQAGSLRGWRKSRGRGSTLTLLLRNNNSSYSLLSH